LEFNIVHIVNNCIKHTLFFSIFIKASDPNRPPLISIIFSINYTDSFAFRSYLWLAVHEVPITPPSPFSPCLGESSHSRICEQLTHPNCSQYSNWLWAGRPRGWSSSPGRVKNSLFSMSSRPALGTTQPPIQWVPGALSPGVKWLGREVDHSPPASAEVKKMWIYTSTCLHGVVLN
jgi:hypothetical protein